MGSYSENIPREKVTRLVKEKKFIKYLLKNPGMTFWMSYSDPEFLHYGVNFLEGELVLSLEGKKFHRLMCYYLC